MDFIFFAWRVTAAFLIVFRSVCSGMHRPDRDADNLNGRQRLVILTFRRYPGNRVRYLLARDDFSKDRVVSIEMSCRGYRNKKLRTVGIWAAVGHGENTRFVKRLIGINFVIELVAWTTLSRSLRITPLNHKVRNDAMKRRPGVKRSMHGFACCGIRPCFRAARQTFKIRHRLWSKMRLEAAYDVSHGGVYNGILAGLGGERNGGKCWFGGPLCGMVLPCVANVLRSAGKSKQSNLRTAKKGENSHVRQIIASARSGQEKTSVLSRETIKASPQVADVYKRTCIGILHHT